MSGPIPPGERRAKVVVGTKIKASVTRARDDGRVFRLFTFPIVIQYIFIYYTNLQCFVGAGSFKPLGVLERLLNLTFERFN